MKKFISKLLVIIAIIAAIVATLTFFGAFAVGSAGFTFLTDFGLTSIASVLSSSGAALLVGGVAGLSLLTGYLIDADAASAVVEDVVGGVVDVVDKTGDVIASVVKQTGKTLGAAVSSLPSWLKFTGLVGCGILVLNLISRQSSPVNYIPHFATISGEQVGADEIDVEVIEDNKEDLDDAF